MNPNYAASLKLLVVVAVFNGLIAEALAEDRQACKVNLILQPGAFSKGAASRLASQIRLKTGHDVDVIEGTRSIPPLVQAVRNHANLWIHITRPETESNNIIVMSTHATGSDEVLQDASASGTDSDEQVATFSQSYADRLSDQKCPAFDIAAIAKNLSAQGLCEELAAIQAHEEIANVPSCDPSNSKTRKKKSKAIPKSILSVRFENIPAKLQRNFATAAESSQLNAQIQNVTEQIAQLSISCTEECRQGVIRLRLPYDSDIYQRRLGSKKTPLFPYRDVAGALLETRRILSSNDSSTPRLPIEIRLIDVGGSELIIHVTGSPSNPSLNAKTSAQEFFHATQSN